MLHTGMENSLTLTPINSSPKEQNGINEEGENFPWLSRMWTGWLLTVCKSILSVINKTEYLNAPTDPTLSKEREHIEDQSQKGEAWEL